MARSLLLTSILIACFVTSSFAQKEIASQNIEWFALATNIKVSKKVSVLAEGQFRYAGNFQPMQFQARTGVDFHINKRWSVMPFAYVYSWNPIYGIQPAAFSNNEHRTFQQVLFRHSAGRFNLNYRARLEQRFIQVHENNNGEVISKGYNTYLNRLRVRVNAQFPLNHKKLEDKTLFAVAYNELFIDFGGATVYTDPDQNRAFIGLGYQVSKKMNFQAGFLYQMLVKLTGTKQENNTGFQVSLNYNIDLTNKEN